MLLAYAAQLKRRADENRAKHQAQRDEKARAEAEAARVRLTPLEDRLARLLATIPLDVQSEGLSLAALQASLGAAGVATVIRANSARLCAGLGSNDSGTGGALMDSARSGARMVKSSGELRVRLLWA